MPPDFGAVGQYALIAARASAAAGRETYLIGLTRGPHSTRVEMDGRLTVQALAAQPYEKTNPYRRLRWTLRTNWRLCAAALRHPRSRHAAIHFTGAPPFMLYFAMAIKVLRSAQLNYRITDFYPEVLTAHWGKISPLFRLALQLTWWLRRRVDLFEAIANDQLPLLVRGGIAPARIVIRRDSVPVVITGDEAPAKRPADIEGYDVLLYSGNYGVAHEVDTVAEGLIRHHMKGRKRFALWLNATGANADALEARLRRAGVPVARTAPVTLDGLPSVLAAADIHLITLRSAFAGIVFPSKVYACLQSRKPIAFVGPATSDVHFLCLSAGSPYWRIEPGDPTAFADMLDGVAAVRRPE